MSKSKSLYSNRIGLVFVSPAVALLLLSIVFPLGYASQLSFFEGKTFIGFGNYIRAFRDKEVWQALGHTVYFTFFSVVAHLVIGLALALLLNSVTKGRTFFRIALLVPWMVAPVVTATTWKWMLNEQYGIINFLLMQIGLIDSPIPWLSNIKLALPAVTVANIWMRFPYVMLMLYSGLQGIPDDLYEAAEVDGANAVQRFFSITLPSLSFIIILTTILDTVYAFRLFDLSNIMTNGGPINASEVLSLYVYRQAFQNLNFNYSSAVAMIMFLITFVFSLVYIKLMNMNREN